MRWNLAVDLGVDAADEFLARHREISGVTVDDPTYWDVVTAVDVLPELDPPGGRPIAGVLRLEELVAAALARL
jgi:hypothetical protein